MSIWLMTVAGPQNSLAPAQSYSNTIEHALAYSRTIFFLARSRTSSSIVSLLTNLYTLTCDFCPIRCARAMACKSFCGFQSLYKNISGHIFQAIVMLTSKIITVSAVSRLIPRPPARVDNKKTKSGEPGALKWAIDFFRASDDTIPSNR